VVDTRITIEKNNLASLAKPLRSLRLKTNKMTKKISKFQKTFIMRNPLVQIFKFIWLNYKILSVVAMGHGGTRENSKSHK